MFEALPSTSLKEWAFNCWKGDTEPSCKLFYPYVALEEVLANAVYHKNYAQREPIQVSIHNKRIEILSFPGPNTTSDLDTILNYRHPTKLIEMPP